VRRTRINLEERVAMELEHLLHQSGLLLIFQFVMVSLMVPAMIGRGDLYRAFVRTATSNVVSFGPLALLAYVLYEVSRLA
jgi:hypothetical protein